MQELKQFFSYVSIKKFISEKTNLKYGSNLSCHIVGKPATKKDTRTEVTPDEKAEIKKSAIKFCKDAIKFFEKW